MTAVLVGPEAEETTVFRAGSLGDCTGVCYVDSEEGRCTQLSTHLAVGMMSEELAHCSHWSGPRSYTRNSGSWIQVNSYILIFIYVKALTGLLP